eukprot:Blabericola_migrator_1__9080@NODE_4842_length_958_cov_3_496072_g3026_i0_p2_GENE_NODE_4842_length_958_cov_3_496072_g3026_i0NODE_4842_length_958_cov_3_496072_g3026_i0_p2_ORF_typecomplete_len131_score3_71_NODE_4842_length_958_cov_3_496072_g3026_i0174566
MFLYIHGKRAVRILSKCRARILRDMIYVLPFGQSIPKTSKGTPDRLRCEEVLSAELERLYSRIDDSHGTETVRRQQKETDIHVLGEDGRLEERVFQVVAHAVSNVLNKDQKDFSNRTHASTSSAWIVTAP